MFDAVFPLVEIALEVAAHMGKQAVARPQFAERVVDVDLECAIDTEPMPEIDVSGRDREKREAEGLTRIEQGLTELRAQRPAKARIGSHGRLGKNRVVRRSRADFARGKDVGAISARDEDSLETAAFENHLLGRKTVLHADETEALDGGRQRLHQDSRQTSDRLGLAAIAHIAEG